MHKIRIITTLAVLSLGFASVPSQAENGRNALGIAGGIAAGALLGSAMSRPAAPPPVVYEEEPVEYIPPPRRCRLEEQPLFDRRGNVVETRTVRICR